jgi:hypothetical protein
MAYSYHKSEINDVAGLKKEDLQHIVTTETGKYLLLMSASVALALAFGWINIALERTRTCRSFMHSTSCSKQPQ